MQTEVAKEVASNLHTALSPEEEDRIENLGTQDPEAYKYYLKGEHLMREPTEMNAWKAIDQFKQAISLDENYAQAHAGLANAYFYLTSWNVPEPDSSYIPVAEKWALRALEMNEDLGEPHFILGAISFYHKWNWKAAENALKAGMELNPNYIKGRVYYANFLTFMNRFEEAMAISEGSIKINPMDPGGYLEMAFTDYNITGDWEGNIELIHKCLELHPDWYNAKNALAMYYAQQEGKRQYTYDYCQEQLDKFHNDLQSIPAFFLGGIGEVLALVGKEAVNEILSELLRRVDENEKDVSYLSLGRIYAALGEHETSLDYLEESIRIREPYAYTISATPVCQSLRSNPRFQDLLASIGINP
jgi:tetratricopeptide (TPR) repeat protein